MNSKRHQMLALVCLAGWGLTPRAGAQSAAQLGVQTYAGLTITGSVGSVYAVEAESDLGQGDTSNAWQCLEFLQLPASPYLWVDKSAPESGQRFYRADVFAAPTNMVFIPPGTFRMGSSKDVEGFWSGEGPQMDVIISRGFWMGRFEVTQAEYQAVMGNNPSTFQRHPNASADMNWPVDNVSWIDATAYCAALTERELAAGRIPANCVYRLPTEAEWEYACRAGTSTRYSYGDDLDYTNLTKYSWYKGNSDDMTHAVGQKLPNPWGLYDMYGNVSEWCQDWYGQYPGGLVLDPNGPRRGESRVTRGGGWSWPAGIGTSADRGSGNPDVKGGADGFRVVLAIAQESR